MTIILPKNTQQYFLSEIKMIFNDKKPTMFYSVVPVDGGWSQWSTWTTCTVTCGGGIQDRLRFCSNPAPKHDGKLCLGNPIEARDCNTQLCPGKSNLYIHSSRQSKEMSLKKKQNENEQHLLEQQPKALSLSFCSAQVKLSVLLTVFTTLSK
jgi:hypothetical protein